MYVILEKNLLTVSCKWLFPALQLSIHNFVILWFDRTAMARYIRCSEIVSGGLKNLRLVEEADVDSHILPRSLLDSWAFCTICTYIYIEKIPWNMVLLDRKGEKANQKCHQWPKEINCSWCRIRCDVLLKEKKENSEFLNVLFPSVWVKRKKTSKCLLKDPHFLCTFHKEICLLEGIAVICFVIVCRKQDCSEGTSCFQ